MGDNTASDESWDLVTSWLSTCESTHTKCSDIQTASPWNPTRLIDIGEARVANAHLIITSENPPKGRYVTLSHCWGSVKALQLTSTRLADLKQVIPMEELPLTFKEAFEVTRRLGFRYIWIDSLCIMQDSKEDWLFEAELMHKVYAHSYCAIAAAASADSSQGLFRRRTPHFLYPCETQIPWFTNDQRKFQLTEFLFWQSQIQEQPLHRRGWVVQERLLAPRVLHFSSQQIVWECRELDAAEKYPKGLPKVLGGTALALFKGLDPDEDGARLRGLSDQDPDPKYYGHHLWDKIVVAYTSSLLTFKGDKLIALSGIAKRQQAELGDEYLAGLWRQWLPSQLLWHVDHCLQVDNSPSVRPEVYRAPSWSWASIDGIIGPGGFSEDGFLIEIVEVSVTPATSDPTGLVESGFVRIRGVLKELRLKRHEFLEKVWWMTVNGMDIRKQGDKEWERMGPLVQLDVDESESSLAGMKYCMPFRAPSEYNTFVTGLILERAGSKEGEFRRIGMFQATYEELHPMILARHENESHLPCESYDTTTRMHTICIV